MKMLSGRGKEDNREEKKTEILGNRSNQLLEKITYGNVKLGSPYILISGALPYSRKQMARASSLAFRATSTGDIFVCI